MKHDKGAKAGYLPAVDFTGGAFERDDKAIAAGIRADPFYRLMPMLTVDEEAERLAEDRRRKPPKPEKPPTWKATTLTHTDRELAELEGAALWGEPRTPRSNATTCPVCGEYKPKRWTLCYHCLHTYGGTVAQMPDWVRRAVNQSRRWHYREERRAQREVPLGEWDVYEGMRGNLGEPPGDYALSYLGDGCGPVPLPYAPYDDEATNRLYRRANGIKPVRTPKGAESPGPSPNLDALGPGARSHHYTALRPNLPAGWWRPGSWAEPERPRSGQLWDYDNPGAYDDREELRQIVAAAGALMSPRQRAILNLAAEGITQAEIGERLGLAQSTVSEHWTQALDKLAQTRTNFLESASGTR